MNSAKINAANDIKVAGSKLAKVMAKLEPTHFKIKDQLPFQKVACGTSWQIDLGICNSFGEPLQAPNFQALFLQLSVDVGDSNEVSDSCCMFEVQTLLKGNGSVLGLNGSIPRETRG